MSKQIMIVFGIVKFNSIANTAEVERVDRVDMHTPEEAKAHAAEVMEGTSMYDSYIIPSLYSGSITWNEHQIKNNYNPPVKEQRINWGDIIRRKATGEIVEANDEWNGETSKDWELFDTEAFFLDYVNNFLTVAKIAEHYNISEDMATQIIELGKEINNSK